MAVLPTAASQFEQMGLNLCVNSVDVRKVLQAGNSLLNASANTEPCVLQGCKTSEILFL